MAAATVDDAPVRPRFDWWLLLVVLMTLLACAPFLRTVYSLADEGQLLHGADRLLRGHRLYADFFEFLPPGGFVLTAAWLGATGVSFGSARLLAILVIAGAACFAYLACRVASRNAPLSAGLVIAWVIMSQGEWTAISHHWFSTLFLMIAAWAALAGCDTAAAHGRRGRLASALLAGLAAGTAAMVTPTRGALGMLAAIPAYLDRRNLRPFAAYVLAGLTVPAGLLGFVLWQQALGAAFDDVIRWTAENYAAIQFVPFGEFASVQNLPLCFVFPVVGVLTVLVMIREGRAALADRMLLTSVTFAVAGFLGCFPRADAVHIAFAVPLAAPLAALCAVRLTSAWPVACRYVVAAGVIGIVPASATAFGVLSREALLAPAMPTPRGSVAMMAQPVARDMIARVAALPPGDTYFFYPYIPMMPFLTGRAHVAFFDILLPGYTTASQYQEACRSAVRQASWVVIDRTMTNPAVLRVAFPAMRDPSPPKVRRFEQALEGAFDLVERRGPFELRHRRDGTSEAGCAAIGEQGSGRHRR
ncbi:MAG: hypothetical protein WDN25_02555 [Acetobacteraceae bacterium]